MSTALARRPLSPRPAATQWWQGDPASLPLLSPEARAAELFLRPGILAPSQCAALIEAAQTLPRLDDPNAFWADRCQHLAAMPEHARAARAMMQQARLITQVLLTQHLRLPGPLYSDTAQLVRWDVGMELTPYADNIHPDGSPNATPHRALSAIIYLNDDYEGGQTYFPGLGVRIAPQTGQLAAFGSGASHVHGVTKVTRGVRYTMAMWFTFDRTWADPVQYAVY